MFFGPFFKWFGPHRAPRGGPNPQFGKWSKKQRKMHKNALGIHNMPWTCIKMGPGGLFFARVGILGSEIHKNLRGNLRWMLVVKHVISSCGAYIIFNSPHTVDGGNNQTILIYFYNILCISNAFLCTFACFLDHFLNCGGPTEPRGGARIHNLENDPKSKEKCTKMR